MRSLARLVAIAASSAPRWLEPRRSFGGATASAAASEAGAGGSKSLHVTCSSVEDTIALGAALAEVAVTGDVIFLRGEYGAGKTCLARGFVQHWRGNYDDQVTSPSYLIDNVYPDEDGNALEPGVAVHHMDLWRLPDGKITQLVDLDRVFAECVSLIEWPERLGDMMPAEHLSVTLAINGPGGEELDLESLEEQLRLVAINAVGASWERRLPSIADAVAAFAPP